jgi:hypothetical protein
MRFSEGRASQDHQLPRIFAACYMDRTMVRAKKGLV